MLRSRRVYLGQCARYPARQYGQLQCSGDLGVSHNIAETYYKTHPTSELPIRPSLRPTAKPDASSSTKLCLSRIASMLVVSPWKMAFPFSLSERPHPSWTLECGQLHRQRFRTNLHETDLLCALSVRGMTGRKRTLNSGLLLLRVVRRFLSSTGGHFVAV